MLRVFFLSLLAGILTGSRKVYSHSSAQPAGIRVNFSVQLYFSGNALTLPIVFR